MEEVNVVKEMILMMKVKASEAEDVEEEDAAVTVKGMMESAEEVIVEVNTVIRDKIVVVTVVGTE